MTMQLTDAVMQLAAALKKKKWMIVTAESCTGGGIAYYLTTIAGSSDYFERGFVTYSNTAKQELLNVDPDILRTEGAVSAAVALQMAAGALAHSCADCSIAITGIAGPGGGSDEKPVGTVHIAWAVRSPQLTWTKHYLFEGDREAIRQQTIKAAIEELIHRLI